MIEILPRYIMQGDRSMWSTDTRMRKQSHGIPCHGIEVELWLTCRQAILALRLPQWFQESTENGHKIIGKKGNEMKMKLETRQQKLCLWYFILGNRLHQNRKTMFSGKRGTQGNFCWEPPPPPPEPPRPWLIPNYFKPSLSKASIRLNQEKKYQVWFGNTSRIHPAPQERTAQ